jgi:YVTN family beta-propeller protein
MAVSPSGTLAVMLGNYQGNYPGSSELLFIDIATGLVRQTIDGASGNIVSISPDGNLVYSLSSSEADEVDLYVADARTGSSSAVITGQSIGGAVISPDGDEIYLLLSPSTAVEAFEEGSPTPSKLLEVGTPPVYLAVSPDGGTLYSAGSNGGLWAISTATGQLLAALLPAITVGAVAVSPDGATLYAVTYNSNDLKIIDAGTGAVLNSIALPGCQGVVAGNIAVAPGGGKLYVMVCGPVIVIDTKQEAIAAAIQGPNGVALAMSPTGRTVYATTGNNSVTPDAIDVIDAATNTITATIAVGASAVAFSPDGTRAYAASTQDNVSGITVIDTASLAAIDFIPGVTSGGAESIAFTPDGELAVVAGGEGSVINTHSLQVVAKFPSADFAAPVVIH